MQGNVYSSLTRCIPLVHAVYGSQNLVHPEGVVELSQQCGSSPQEVHHALCGAQFSRQIGWHAGFTVTCETIIVNAYLYVGCAAPRIRSNRKDVAQLQLVWFKRELQSAACPDFPVYGKQG